MNIILLVIYIILMALNVWGAYTEGLARGQEKILKRWEETEYKRLKEYDIPYSSDKEQVEHIRKDHYLDPRGRN